MEVLRNKYESFPPLLEQILRDYMSLGYVCLPYSGGHTRASRREVVFGDIFDTVWCGPPPWASNSMPTQLARLNGNAAASACQVMAFWGDFVTNPLQPNGAAGIFTRD